MRMLWRSVVGFIGMSMVLGLLGGPAAAENRSIGLNGFDEVPVVITDATGRFHYRIDGKETQIEYTLSYDDLDQSAHGTVRFGHIHIGSRHTTGQIVVFLCTNEAPPANVPVPPPCPQPPGGSVSGILTAANVIPRLDQGIGLMDLAGVIEAIRTGVAYVNVHTTVSPSGIIRGQFVGKH
jgi:hypothetical protein